MAAGQADPYTGYLRDRIVLVTGAAGTVGRALVDALAAAPVRMVRLLDHGESELFHLYETRRNSPVTPLLGDVRDLERLRLAFAGVDVIFHAAALKHVELGEYNPIEVVETNLRGATNVIRAALDADVERIIFTSSDKAVSPTNVMGASKMMGERLFTAANDMRGRRRSRFASVRFGNVLGSRGSAVSIFATAAKRGEPMVLRHPEMTRYIMTVDEAARLVLEAGQLMQGGEVFVTKMRPVRIQDLAQVIAEELGIQPPLIVTDRPRAGEKLHEELVAREELERAFESDRLIVVLPYWRGELTRPVPRVQDYGIPLAPLTSLWNSGEQTPMRRDELRDYLRQHRILENWRSA